MASLVNGLPEYTELHCISNFTFLRGASHPEELVNRAFELGYSGLSLTDECSLAGVVRAHSAARETGLKLIVGSEFRFEDGLNVAILAADRASYAALCRLITQGRRAAAKGAYQLSADDMAAAIMGSSCQVLWLADNNATKTQAKWLQERFVGQLWLAAEIHACGNDRGLLDQWRKIAHSCDIPLVASGNVHMHCRQRRPLQDTLTAIRHRTPLSKAGFLLHPNGERYLRSRKMLSHLYPEGWLRATMAVAERIDFSLQELRYEYPRELVPEGETSATYLRKLTQAGMRWRWPEGPPIKVQRLVEYELKLIGELRYESYFLTVHDIVNFARRQGILCQGRGSAANSAVCFCLGITEVDPGRMEMLVERFISKERNEPPDIDVDFEHERREEVIQYIYEKYGRERAALAATVIRYRPRSAMRDVGKALGLSDTQVDTLAKSLQWWEGQQLDPERITEAGLDPSSPVLARLLQLVTDILGFPRHLSQHVGGFVISEGDLCELVPVENATMPERTVIQWDKDDLDNLGLLKVDVLGLGMLSAIQRSLQLLRRVHDLPMTMATIPAEDSRVYDMICNADTMGVFQIESRAQMAMLPRLKPRCYYDLVIEVAIIRPGPIQGDMVHPYLRRRNGEEAVAYPNADVEKVLRRTLGVPIFQEQVMQLAMVAAGFTPGEADELRRAMAAWKRRGGLEGFETRLLDGMLTRGYSRQFATQIFNQIKGFGEYGFPESHSASFALLVYVSAWLKCHHPAIFCCALLNSQPMGFYAPAQLIRNAREHGVDVRAADINNSDYDCSIEKDAEGNLCLRLGLRLVRDLSRTGVEKIVAVRRGGRFLSVQSMAERCQLNSRDMGALAAAGVLAPITGNRHLARWQVAGIEPTSPLLPNIEIAEATPLLRPPGEGDDLVADYRQMGLSLGRHPLALLRDNLRKGGVVAAKRLAELSTGRKVYVAGLVLNRQRPSSAAGVTFVTLEDETGYVNLIVWQRTAEIQRRTLLGASLLGVRGEVQHEHGVIHVVAEQLIDHSTLLGRLTARSRDFR